MSQNNEVDKAKTIQTIDGKTVDILDVPFLGEEQPLKIKKGAPIKATVDNGFLLLKNESTYIDINSIDDLKKAEENINNNLANPVLFIDVNVYARIYHILHRAKNITGNECAGLFIYKRLNPNLPHYLVTDFILVGQEASSGAVELDDIDMSKYIAYIEKNYLEDIKQSCVENNTLFTGNILDYIGHWHSHGTMGTFWSGTDTKQQEDKTQLGFNAQGRFYIVFNIPGSIHSSYIQYFPYFQRKDNISIGLYIGDGYSFDEKDREHLDMLIDKLIICKQYRSVSFNKNTYNTYDSSVYARYARNSKFDYYK